MEINLHTPGVIHLIPGWSASFRAIPWYFSVRPSISTEGDTHCPTGAANMCRFVSIHKWSTSTERWLNIELALAILLAVFVLHHACFTSSQKRSISTQKWYISSQEDYFILVIPEVVHTGVAYLNLGVAYPNLRMDQVNLGVAYLIP